MALGKMLQAHILQTLIKRDKQVNKLTNIMKWIYWSDFPQDQVQIKMIEIIPFTKWNN